jgi:hypothetical protein
MKHMNDYIRLTQKNEETTDGNALYYLIELSVE